MAALDIVSLDTATPQLEVPQSGDTYNAPRAVTIAPVALTGSTATPALDIAQTWNTTGTPTGIRLSVTDTASNAASNLLELRGGAAGTTNLFSVSKSGVGYFLGKNDFSPDINFGPTAAVGIGQYLNNSFFVRIGTATPLYANGQTSTVQLGLNYGLGFTGLAGATSAPDVLLFRDGAAATLAQRNGTAAQTFRVYGTWANTGTDFERFFISAPAGAAVQLGTQKGGTGTARALEFQTDGTTRLTISAAGTVFPAGNFVMQSSAVISFDSRGDIAFTADGVMRLRDSATSSFGRLAFGGTTSSFPAIKRSTTSLQARLADDSAFTNIQGKLTADVNAVAETPTATHTITIYDAAGTGYKVLCVAA